MEARLARRTRVPAIAAIFDEHQPVPRRPRLARRLDRADHIVAIAVEKEDRLPPGRCGTIKGGKTQAVVGQRMDEAKTRKSRKGIIGRRRKEKAPLLRIKKRGRDERTEGQTSEDKSTMRIK